jgi:hypothetical protein
VLRNLVCTRLPFDSRAPSAPDESLAVLVRGHEVAPRTQTDDSHDAIIDIDWLVGKVEHHLYLPTKLHVDGLDIGGDRT